MYAHTKFYTIAPVVFLEFCCWRICFLFYLIVKQFHSLCNKYVVVLECSVLITRCVDFRYWGKRVKRLNFIFNTNMVSFELHRWVCKAVWDQFRLILQKNWNFLFRILICAHAIIIQQQLVNYSFPIFKIPKKLWFYQGMNLSPKHYSIGFWEKKIVYRKLLHFII